MWSGRWEGVVEEGVKHLRRERHHGAHHDAVELGGRGAPVAVLLEPLAQRVAQVGERACTVNGGRDAARGR